MQRFVSSRAISIGFAISAVALTQAQTYYSPDDLFASPSYFTPSDVSFSTGDGSVGEVSFTKLRVSIGRVVLPLDSSVHQYVFGFDCTAGWSFGASNPPVSGSGNGKMSMSLHYDGTTWNGGYAFTGQLNTFDCVCRTDRQASLHVHQASSLDSFVRFNIKPITSGALAEPNTTSAGFLVDSSFDTSLSASVDGGQTWNPSLGTAHFQGTPEPASVAAMGLGLGTLLRRRSRKSVKVA